MRQYLITNCLIVMAAAVPMTAFAQSKKQKEPDWQQHESELMNYKIVFPGKFKDVTKKNSTPAGDVILNTASVETRDLTYAVTAALYPDKFKEADQKKLFESAKDALSANGGKLEKDDPFEVTGANAVKYNGRDVTVAFGKNVIRTRLILINSILYQISVTGTEKAQANPVCDKFIRSFEYTK